MVIVAQRLYQGIRGNKLPKMPRGPTATRRRKQKNASSNVKKKKKEKMNMNPCMGVTPRPSWEAPWVANIIFGRGCKRGFHSSTFYFRLHFSTESLTNFEKMRPEQ